MRIPKGSTCIKNLSNDIFKFGGNLDYEPGAKARYDRTPVADLEKKRGEQKRDHEASRNLARRTWIADIEQNRWNKMAQDYCKKEQEWLNRHSVTKMGKNSVSYNPITLEYHQNSDGAKLSQDDAKALYRTSMRAAHLYLKNNTFDPLRCQDIPRRLVIDPNESTAQQQPQQKQDSELDVPRRLALVAAQRAHQVKTKVEDADRVLKAEMKRVANADMRVAAAGTARLIPKKDLKPTSGGAIVVEMDGNGKNQHSWMRHF